MSDMQTILQSFEKYTAIFADFVWGTPLLVLLLVL